MPRQTLSKTAILLTAFLPIIFLFSLPELQAADYVFKDENGNDVNLPTNLPVLLMDRPGAHAHLAAFHIPEIQTRIRKEGLESVREITLRLPPPSPNDPEDLITKVYIRDKDGLIVGYRSFKDNGPKAKFRMNGIINYIQIYVECNRHGLWRKDIKFEKQKAL